MAYMVYQVRVQTTHKIVYVTSSKQDALNYMLKHGKKRFYLSSKELV